MPEIIGGTDYPKIQWGPLTNPNSYNCPYPQLFNEKYEPVALDHELIDHDIQTQHIGWRYTVEIDWHLLNEEAGGSDVQNLIQIFNWLKAANNRTIRFWPHQNHSFYVDVYLDSDWQLDKISTKQKYAGHSLKLKLKSKKLVSWLPYFYNWPTSHTDAAAYWTNPANAYDGSIITYASHASAPSGWSDYLQFNFSPGLVNQIGVKVGNFDSIEIDVYDLNLTGWHAISTTSITPNTFSDQMAPTIYSDKIRMRLNLTAGGTFYIYSFRFGIIL